MVQNLPDDEGVFDTSDHLCTTTADLASFQLAILEAKHGSGLGSLSIYKGPLRQGGRDYNIDRLEKYIDLGRDANIDLANELIRGSRAGTVDSYASFYRGNSLYKLDFDRTVNFRLNPELAVKQN